MSEIKKYLDLGGLQQYDGLIKEYIQTRDGYVAGSCVFDTASNQWQYTKDDGTKVTLSLSELYKLILAAEEATAQVLVDAKAYADQAELDAIAAAANDAASKYAVKEHTHEIGEVSGLQDALAGKVDKVEGSRLMTDAEGTKLAGIEAGAKDNVIETVKVNGTALTPDASKAVDITIPAATVTGVDGTTVNGMKLSLEDTKVKLVDDGLASTLTSKDITVQKKDGTTDDQCVYEILQGGVVVGTINHPKDLVVESGEIVEVDGVKYLRLTIANQDDPVDIAVTDLVDAYTPGAGIAISETNEVSIALNPTQGNVTLSTDGGLKATVDLSGTQEALSETQLAAVNSGINATDWSSVKTAVDNLGSTISTALGNYYTKDEVNTLLADKLDAADLVAISGDEISDLFA